MLIKSSVFLIKLFNITITMIYFTNVENVLKIFPFISIKVQLLLLKNLEVNTNK